MSLRIHIARWVSCARHSFTTHILYQWKEVANSTRYIGLITHWVPGNAIGIRASEVSVLPGCADLNLNCGIMCRTEWKLRHLAKQISSFGRSVLLSSSHKDLALWEGYSNHCYSRCKRSAVRKEQENGRQEWENVMKARNGASKSSLSQRFVFRVW